MYMSDVIEIESLAVLQYSARYRTITRDTESFTLLKAKSIRYMTDYPLYHLVKSAKFAP